MFTRLLLAAGLLLAQPLILPYTPVAMAAAPRRVVVLPLKLIGPGDAWLGESFAERLTLALSQAGDVTVIERAQIDKILQEQGFGQSALADEASAPQLGRLLGAQELVLGSLERQGDQLIVSLRRVDAVTGQVLTGSALRLQGPAANLAGLQQQAAVQVLKQLTGIPELRARELVADQGQTSSARALELYHRALGLERNLNDANLQQAIENLHQAVNLDPKYTLAYAALSEAYSVRAGYSHFLASARPDDMEQALAYAKLALAQGNNLAAVYRALARAHFARGNRSEALQAIEQALALKPGDSLSIQAWLNYSDHPPLAQLRRELAALGADPEDAGLQLELAQMEIFELKHQEQPDFGPVRELLERLQQREPTNPYVLLKLADIAASEDDFNRASQLADQALKLDPENFMVHFIAGTVLFKAPGQEARVEANFRRSLALFPRFGFAHTFLGMYYLSHGRLDQARAEFLEGQRLQPLSAFAPMMLAQMAEIEDNPVQAYAYYRQALENHGKVLGEEIQIGDLLLNLYRLALQLKRPEADAYLSRLQQGGPGIHPKHYRQLVGFLALTRQFNKAQDVFRRYTQPPYRLTPEDERTYRRTYLLEQLAARPDDPALLNDLGSLAMLEEDLEQADALLAKAIGLAPRQPAILFNLGLLRLQQQRPAEAAELLQQVLVLQPDHAKARYNLAQARIQLGQKAEARALLQALLQADPGNQDALRALEMLR
ncbi:MAG: tetratricopeptide repeat protein [Candidatus Sericytochromatia bacterium]